VERHRVADDVGVVGVRAEPDGREEHTCLRVLVGAQLVDAVLRQRPHVGHARVEVPRGRATKVSFDSGKVVPRSLWLASTVVPSVANSSM